MRAESPLACVTHAAACGCRNKADFIEDVREQYKEMRDEFMAGLEDRKYLSIDHVRQNGLQVSSPKLSLLADPDLSHPASGTPLDSEAS